MKQIKFNKRAHSYKVGHKELESVTKFLSRFLEEFDADAIARLKAMITRKQGIKGQGIRYWKNKWKQTAEDGSLVHWLIEQELIGIVPEDVADFPLALRNKFSAAKNFMHDYFRTLGEPNPVPEVIVYNENIGIAGTVDLVVEKNKMVGGHESTARSFDIIDWKTNEKIATEGYKGKSCKPPIEHLPDCAMTKYELQLSLYKYLLELSGYEIDKLILVNLRDDETYIKYEVPYRREEIERLLEWQRK